ncbi:MAG: Fic family protein [Caldilineaceae bacterium]
MSERQRDEQEIINAYEVMTWITHLSSLPDLVIDVDLICHINRLTLHNTDRHHWAGRIRSEVDWPHPDEWSRLRAIVATEEARGLVVLDENTGQVIVQFPSDREVGTLVDLLLQWLNADHALTSPPLVRAAIFHQRFTQIHPFRDGNGRTARALTTLVLWQAGFPVQILALQRILDERREQYIDALRSADQGNVQRWVQFFAQAVRDALHSGLLTTS